MHRVSKLLLPLLLLTTAVALPQSFTNFASLSGFKTTSGSFAPSGAYPTGGDLNLAALAGAFFADQYACEKFTGASANISGPAVRMSTSAATGYVTFINNGTFQLYKVVAGSGTTHAQGSSLAVGHEYCVVAVGSTITLYDDGASVASFSDADIKSGNPGISSYGGGNAGSLAYGFRAGSGAVPPPPRPVSVSISTPSTATLTGAPVRVTCTATFSGQYNGGCTGDTLVSSDSSVATASRLTLTLLSPGTTRLTYTQGDVTSNTITLTVQPHARATYYVRADGGTRYTAARIAAGLSGQCDGLADVSYASTGGSGSNHHCAFNDLRFLWDDQTYGNSKWVLLGGDRVILDNTRAWRVGMTRDGTTTGTDFCLGGQGTFGCTNPTIPSGTRSQHTEIFGRNFASCNTDLATTDRSRLTEIFGGHGVYTPLNLAGAKFLDVSCLQITRHSQCTLGGSPPYPSFCRKEAPIDDFDSDGIETDNTTADVTLTDLWIHGHPGRGIKGPIGGVVTANRVVIGYNGGAGWDFDNGSTTPSDIMPPGTEWHFNYSTIEWSGCNQEYPIVHTFPAIACYGQSTGGYGDGVGTAPGQGLDVFIDHSTFRYNVQDGEDFGHVDVGQHVFSVTNSNSYANGGGQFKWGWGFTDIRFLNNVVISNCYRLASPIGDAPYIRNGTPLSLGDLCRSGDALSFNFEDRSTALFANNTIVTVAPTTFDAKCVPISSQNQTSCKDAVFTLKNNIVRAYADSTNDYGGNSGPAAFCLFQCNDTQQQLGTVNRAANIFYGMRGSCIANQPTYGANFGTSTGEQCADPLFVGEPRGSGSSWKASELDNFNIALTSASPAKGTGVAIPGVLQDFSGDAYADPRSMGALEHGHAFTPNSVAISRPTVQSISITPGVPLAILVGRSGSMNCLEYLSDGATLSCTSAAKWSSSDPRTLTVAGGTLRAVAPGSATITASVGGHSATSPANAVTIAGIDLSPDSMTLTAGAATVMTCATVYSDTSGVACPETTRVTNAAPAIATAALQPSGQIYVTAVAPGSDTITYAYGGFTHTVTIKVISPADPYVTSIALTAARSVLAAGTTETLTCTATYSNRTTGPCPSTSLISSNTLLATTSGLTVTGVSSGKLIVFANSVFVRPGSPSPSASIELTVRGTAPPAKDQSRHR